VVNITTGAARIVDTTMDILSVGYADGAFWALGTVCLACPQCVQCPGNPSPSQRSLIARLDLRNGAIETVANLTKCDRGSMVLGRSTMDRANGVMYFACDPDFVGVSVRTGKVVMRSPLVHWADGTADSTFTLGMQFEKDGSPSGPAARRRQQGGGTPVFDPVHPDKNPGAQNNAGWLGLVKSEMPAEKMRAVAVLMSEQHLPRGTYGDSCQGCVIEGAVLSCEPGCNNGQGETLKTSVDTTGCASASFENTRGVLRCQGEPAGRE
jgi:hypothetical protein